MAQRRTAAWLCLAASALIVGGCSSQTSSAPAVAHRPPPPKTGGTTTVAPPSTTPGPPSAVPTTVLPPAVPAPGWTQALTALPPGGGFSSLSCLSDTFCIAAGGGTSGDPSELTAGSGVAESWDGAAWSEPSVYYPGPATGSVTAPVLPAVACTSGPSCLIADGSGHTSDGNGTDWSTPTAMPTAPSMPTNPDDPGAGHPGSRTMAVSCPSPTFCAFVDNTGHTYELADGRWLASQSFGTPSGHGAPVSLYQPGRVGVSCPTPSACMAVVGASVLDWNGSSWAEESEPWTSSLASGASDATAISCPTASLCAIANGTGVSMGSPGGPWSSAPNADPDGQLDSISCPSATFCLAAGSSGSVVTWNGAGWSSPDQVIPSADEYPGNGTSVSCPNPQFCMVLNGDGDYATYSGSPSPS